MVPPRTYQKALRICADAGDRMTRIETDVDQEQSNKEHEDSQSEHDGDPRDDEEERDNGGRSDDKVEEPEETQDNERAEQPGQGRTGTTQQNISFIRRSPEISEVHERVEPPPQIRSTQENTPESQLRAPLVRSTPDLS
ncbi:hypothetical protein FRC08_009904 [Ceratobasidium sp. 394]|nr:hypothetical protein FRC08_009904 [Ceratobasidium sp. 394]